MDDKRIHVILKTCMVLIILIFAWFFPHIVFRGFQGSTADTEQRIVEDQSEGTDQSPVADRDIGEDLFSGADRLIILDPGHGGYDPGMIGVGGIEEKKINLQVAKVLAGLLEESGFKVLLTRTDDGGLYDEDAKNRKNQDMQRRCKLIEENEPLFTVSIHQNSYSDPSACGPQVFYFEKSQEGQKLAACIQKQLNERLQIAQPREIKGNTNYYMLKRSKSVTVLVECTFLSNPEEAKKIQTSQYQEAVALAIRDGILEYVCGIV